MVLIPNREPDVFAAISHPARRRMLDLRVLSASVNESREPARYSPF